MPSNHTQNAEPSAGGKGIFIALIPWIIFTVLASHAALKSTAHWVAGTRVGSRR